MATAKIGRHSKRSPAASRYRNESRDKANKIKKLQRHLKAHPEDKKGADAFNHIKSGKSGQPGKFPMPAKPEEAKRDSRMEQPTREDYSKHQLLFFVVSVPDNVVLTVTPFWSEAIKTYTKTHTKSVIEQQKGRGPRQVIRAQRAKA